MRNRADLALVIALALAANFGYMIASNGDFYFPDSFTYLTPAHSVLQGRGFLNDSGGIDTLRTPGYPLLLALFGATTLPMIILQHLLNAILAAGIYLLVLRRIGSRFAALIASLLFAIDTPTLHYANKILSETVFTVLLFAASLLILGRPRPLWTGMVAGIMVLVRPIAVLYFGAVLLLYAIWRIPLRQMAILTVAALVLPLAWAGRNAAQTGVFTISSVAGMNMLNHRAAAALAIEDRGDDFRADLAGEQNGLMEDADDAIQRQLGIEDARELPDAVRARYYSRFALKVIAHHPLGFIGATIRGLLVNLFDSDWDAMQVVSRIYAPILEWTLGVIPITEFAFALIGIVVLWRIDRRLALLIFFTVAYFVVMSAGSEAESRFRVPVVPQMVIAAAAGMESARRGTGAFARNKIVAAATSHRDVMHNERTTIHGPAASDAHLGSDAGDGSSIAGRGPEP